MSVSTVVPLPGKGLTEAMDPMAGRHYRNKIAILWQRKYQFPFHLYQKLLLTGAQAHDEQLADHDRFATASLSSLDRFVDGISLSGPTTESERR